MMRDSDQLSGPPTELIFGDWYPAMRADELRAKKTAKAMLLGVPLLLGRKNDGKLFAMRDLCPHRGIPLSAGWFDGQSVTCKYHGWHPHSSCRHRQSRPLTLTREPFSSQTPAQLLVQSSPKSRPNHNL